MTDKPDVRTLAQELYEASNTTGVPWSHRGRTIQDAWLAAAHRHLDRPAGPVQEAASPELDKGKQPWRIFRG